MKIDLSGKRAIVTGSTAGIGFATATGLAGAGAAVIVNGRSEAAVEAALKRLRATLPGAKLEGIAGDLGTAEGVERFLARVGECDILVNNLGIYEEKPFEAISDADWFRIFEVNVMSGVRLARHYLPRLLKRGWGRIVFVSSESARQIPVEMIHYGMTKTAQLAVSRGLAELTRGTAVTVNAVLPGPTLTDTLRGVFEAEATAKGLSIDEVARRFIAELRPTSLIQRWATPEEVASMIVYVVSPQASATNGAALSVDGGVVKAIP